MEMGEQEGETVAFGRRLRTIEVQRPQRGWSHNQRDLTAENAKSAEVESHKQRQEAILLCVLCDLCG
jgi:hypothetical protein